MRNKLIDSTRGACILLVILYHFHFTAFFNKNGLYGVLIFFIISGYCMVQSIKSSSNLLDFLEKRFFRLFPGLVICGLLSTIIENSLPTAVPENVHTFSDYLKTLFFLPFLNIPLKILSVFSSDFTDYKFVDGSYWSLVVEFKFYYLLALIYFFFNRRNYYLLLLVIAIIFSLAIKLAMVYSFQITSLILDFAEYLPYFIIGIGLNICHFGKKTVGIVLIMISLILLITVNLMGIPAFSLPFTVNSFVATLVAVVWIYGLHYIKINNIYLDRFFSALAFIGKISYPLYLLHQEIGIAFIKSLLVYQSPFVSKIIVTAFLVFLAFLVNRYFENLLHKKNLTHKITYASSKN